MIITDQGRNTSPAQARQLAATADAATGIAFGSVVLTAQGERAVETLSPGDRVITRDGIRRLSAAITDELTGTVVRISASALGHDRPEADVLLAPGQLILLRDWRAQALYGRTAALVPVSRLTDGEYICVQEARTIQVVTLCFEQPCVVYVNGLEIACPAG